MKPIFFLSLWLGMASVCLAESPEKPAAIPRPPLPSGPLLAAIPDNSQWTITRSDVVAKKGKNSKMEHGAPFIEKIEGEKTGQTRHVITTSGNGGKIETWQDGHQLVTTHEGWKTPLVTTQEANRPEFELMDWISPATFTAISKVEGRDCLIFQARIFPSGGDQNLTKASLDGIDPETLKVPAEASIDVTTRLPVRLQVGNEQTVYEFRPLHPATLTVPAEIGDSASKPVLDDHERKSSRKPHNLK